MMMMKSGGGGGATKRRNRREGRRGLKPSTVVQEGGAGPSKGLLPRVFLAPASSPLPPRGDGLSQPGTMTPLDAALFVTFRVALALLSIPRS